MVIKGFQVKNSKLFRRRNVALMKANSVDQDEMPFYGISSGSSLFVGVLIFGHLAYICSRSEGPFPYYVSYCILTLCRAMDFSLSSIQLC